MFILIIALAGSPVLEPFKTLDECEAVRAHIAEPANCTFVARV